MSTTDRDALLIRVYLEAYLAGAGVGPGVSWPKGDMSAHYAVVLGVSHGALPHPPLSRSALLAEVDRLCGEERPKPPGEVVPADDMARDAGYTRGGVARLAFVEGVLAARKAGLPDADTMEAHLDGQAAGRAEVLDALEKCIATYRQASDAGSVVAVGNLREWIAEQRKPTAATHRAHDGALHAGPREGCGMCEVGHG